MTILLLKQSPFAVPLVLALTILCIYLEYRYLKLYFFFKKNGVIKSASIIFSYQTHNGRAVYKIKMEGLNLPYSKHQLKTSFFSSLYPKLLKNNFNVYYHPDYDFCMLVNPITIIIDFIIISAVTIFMFSLIHL